MNANNFLREALYRPRGRDWYPEEIRAALVLKKITLRQLSIGAGYKPGSIRRALDKSYPAAQAVIARALGVDPWEIWPSRYDAERRPIRRRLTYPVRRAAPS
ncbi:MAG: helix-turn-helix domain-containing protein [Magnetococcales bacterium]|nr:helix-turn-helix domain-containing protein [Magnetococcales bacterium]